MSNLLERHRIIKYISPKAKYNWWTALVENIYNFFVSLLHKLSIYHCKACGIKITEMSDFPVFRKGICHICWCITIDPINRRHLKQVLGLSDKEIERRMNIIKQYL